jgi:mono/diheme cytochrome c family protein
MTRILAALAVAAALAAGTALAEGPQDALLAGYVAEAGAPASAARGEAFFKATHSGGKPDTASCTACHTADPRSAGRTRAGKPIEPMAVSVSPDRFTDPAKVEKWFRRNCNSVLGRECTAAEKADVVAWLTGQ